MLAYLQFDISIKPNLKLYKESLGEIGGIGGISGIGGIGRIGGIGVIE